ncbi:MAG: hypothetical protein ACXAD7_14085, partial [Candidatus Kariarchaeaceae archaeon]
EIDVSSIGTDTQIKYLQNNLLNIDDLTPEISVSGEYPIQIQFKDGETILDSTETQFVVNLDKDGDLMTDEMEILYSNTIDYLDFDINSTDSDGDDQVDPVEYVLGNDVDGDGLPEFYEDYFGTSDENPDTDGDGLTDGYGFFGERTYGSNGTNPDTDGDQISDYNEVIGWQMQLITPKGLVVEHVSSSPIFNDTDSDGVSDYYEQIFKTNPQNEDSDGDGLTDKREQEAGTSMLNQDSDFDGITDFDEFTKAFTTYYYDADGKELSKTYYLNPTNPDSDNDTINDFDELYVYFTIGTNKDSDSDGIDDNLEITKYNTDPIRADTDGDRLADGLELTGFDIPLIIFTPGKYNESGGILQAPEVSNYTIHVTTDPLNMDTDGDGLTDWEELLSDDNNIGDPTNVDSDSDGILDLFDDARLVSDFTPPNITSQIDIAYTVGISKQTEIFVETLKASLSTVWEMMKNTGRLVIDLIKSFFYMKKSCFWGICIKTPRIHSWSSIVNNVKNAIRKFVDAQKKEIFTLAEQFTELISSTIGFENLGLKLVKVFGIPVAVTITGNIKIIAKKVVDTITGIVDPIVIINMDIRDPAGIDKIKIYQDNKYLKTINDIDSTYYYFDETFDILHLGFTVNSTIIRLEIYDKNGNIRVLERTTSITDFVVGSLEQTWTLIEETAEYLLNKLKDAWEWALDGLSYIGEKAKEAAEAVYEFLNNTYHKVKDWINEQFNRIWEGFVQDTLNLLVRGNEYIERAEELLVNFSNSYTSVRPDIANGIDSSLLGLSDKIVEGLDEINDVMEENLPPMDVEALTDELGDFVQPLVEFFDGSALEFAYNLIRGGAIKIVMNVVKRTLQSMGDNAIASYAIIIVDIVEDLLAKMIAATPDIVPLDVGTEGGAEGMLNMFTSLIEKLAAPAATLGEIIDGFNGDYILQLFDAFLQDDSALLISLNDVIRTMLKPMVALTLVFSDLLSFSKSLITDILNPNFSDVGKLNFKKVDKIATEGVLKGVEIRGVDYGFSLKIVAFIGKIIDFIYTEGKRVYEVVDKAIDQDVEKEALIAQSIMEFFVFCVSDGIEIIGSFIEGNIPDAANLENHLLLKSLVMGTGKALGIVLSGIISVFMPKLDIFELLVTWIFDIIGWIMNIVDTVWHATIMIVHANELSVAKWIAMSWELVALLLNCFYDPISTILLHGYNLQYLAEPTMITIAVIAYAAFAAVSLFAIFSSLIVSFIADVVDYVISY